MSDEAGPQTSSALVSAKASSADYQVPVAASGDDEVLSPTEYCVPRFESKSNGSSLVTGHVPTHPFPVASPDPNQTLPKP